MAEEISPQPQFPNKERRAEYRLYEYDSEVPKYWVNKNNEGKVMIYDDPSMKAPKLELRNGKIYRPNGIFPLGRIKILGDKIYKPGKSRPFLRIEKVTLK